jgi:ribosomal protein S18 acetylase RimI-like enzyme
MFIEPLPPVLFDSAIALWREAGLIRPWNDPEADLQRAVAGPASAVLAGLEDDVLVATVMVGHDGHRGWAYYVAVAPDARGNSYGREIMRAAEEWLIARGITKLNLMIREDNESTTAFYAAIGYSRDQVIVVSKRLD